MTEMDREPFYDLTRSQCIVFRGVPSGPAVPLALRRKQSRWHDQAWRQETDRKCRQIGRDVLVVLTGGAAIALAWQMARAWL